MSQLAEKMVIFDLFVFEDAFLIVIFNTPSFVICILKHIVWWVCNLNKFEAILTPMTNDQKVSDFTCVHPKPAVF